MGRAVITPPTVVAASPSDTAEPPWLSYVMLSVVTIEYTRTWPAKLPLSSFPKAPIARIVPSDDNDTELPE